MNEYEFVTEEEREYIVKRAWDLEMDGVMTHQEAESFARKTLNQCNTMNRREILGQDPFAQASHEEFNR